MIEECVDGAADAEGAANTDVRLIDDEQNQPATGRILVAGIIPGRGRRGGRLFLRFEASPLGVDDATLRTVHPYTEVTRLQIGHRLPAVIHEGDEIDVSSTDDRNTGWFGCCAPGRTSHNPGQSPTRTRSA